MIPKKMLKNLLKMCKNLRKSKRKGCHSFVINVEICNLFPIVTGKPKYPFGQMKIFSSAGKWY